MAVNCWVSPAATEAVVGETVIATSTAAPAGWLVSGSSTPTARAVMSIAGTRMRMNGARARALRSIMAQPPLRFPLHVRLPR